MMMRLFYRDWHVADIVEDDRDFPTCFGHFRLSPDVETIASGKIKEYADYSIATWPLIEADRTNELDFGDEEKRFGELIEPSEWWLATATQKMPILIPNFCTEGRINWRFDPERETQAIAKRSG